MPSLSCCKNLSSIQKFNIILLLMIVGFVSSIMFHYVAGFYLKWDYPYWSCLVHPQDMFRDYLNVYPYIKERNPYATFLSAYFPFAYLIGYVYTWLDPIFSLRAAYLPIAITFLVFAIGYLYRVLMTLDKAFTGSESLLQSSPSAQPGFSWAVLASVSLVVLAYPVIFILDRGNIEGWLFISIAMFVWFYLKKRYGWSAFFLALGIAMKGYPIVFAVMYLVDRRYRYIGLVGLLVLCLTYGSAALLQGGMMHNLHYFKLNLAKQSTFVTVDDIGLQHSLSLFAAIKVFLKYILGWAINDTWLVRCYSVLVVVLAGVTTWQLWRGHLLVWQKLFLIVGMMMILPHFSYDYKGIHLLIPLVFFLKENQSHSYDWFWALGFGLLLIPKAYYYIHADISIGVILNPLLVIGMSGLMFRKARLACGSDIHG